MQCRGDVVRACQAHCRHGGTRMQICLGVQGILRRGGNCGRKERCLTEQGRKVITAEKIYGKVPMRECKALIAENVR